jgi:hypothetical protein
MDEHQAQQHPGDAVQQRGLVGLMAHGAWGLLGALCGRWPALWRSSLRAGQNVDAWVDDLATAVTG